MYIVRTSRILLLAIVGLTTTLIGLLVYLYLPQLMRLRFSKELVIVEGSTTYPKWKKIPVPIYTEVYLFNITNPTEVYEMKEKPRLKEMGPYTFREEREKVNVTWHKDGRVSYRQIKRWYFEEDLTIGSLDDNVTTLNVPMMVVAHTAKRTNTWYYYKSMQWTLSDSTWFITRSVKELLFEGYPDNMMEYAYVFRNTALDRFGWFYKKNNSDDGLMTINSGLRDVRNLDTVVAWKGNKRLTNWDPPCDSLRASAGDLWPPFLSKDERIGIFAPDLCRILRLTFEKEVTVMGVDGYRYYADESELDNGHTDPSKKCFCVRGHCLPPGGLDVSTCSQDVPIVISYPHFLYADSIYSESVSGLKPDPEKHVTYVELQKDTGLPLNVAAKMQINIILERVDGLRQFSNVSKRIYFPVIWVSESGRVNEEIASEMKMVLYTLPLIINVFCVIFMVIGIALMCLALFFSRKKKTQKLKDKRKNDTQVHVLQPCDDGTPQKIKAVNY